MRYQKRHIRARSDCHSAVRPPTRALSVFAATASYHTMRLHLNTNRGRAALPNTTAHVRNEWRANAALATGWGSTLGPVYLRLWQTLGCCSHVRISDRCACVDGLRSRAPSVDGYGDVRGAVRRVPQGRSLPLAPSRWVRTGCS